MDNKTSQSGASGRANRGPESEPVLSQTPREPVIEAAFNAEASSFAGQDLVGAISRLSRVEELLTFCGERYAGTTAVSTETEDVTYLELRRRSEQLAGYLSQEAGLSSGDRVCLLLPNSVDFLVSYFAVLYCGAVVSPVDVALSRQELGRTFKAFEPRLIVSNATLSAAASESDYDCPVVEVDRLELYGRAGLVANAEPELAMAVCPYSSGTTGHPKGVCLRHDNLLANLRSLVAREPSLAQRHRVFGCPLPLHHVFPMTLLVLFPFALGAQVVLIESKSPAAILRTLSAKRVSFFAGVPALFSLLAQVSDPSAFGPLGELYWASGGSALASDVRRRFESTFRAPLYQGYGLTETSPVLTWNTGRSSRDSVGTAIPGVELRIVDQDGNPVDRGEVGEVTARGANVMHGYLDDPNATKDVLPNGWFHTGDSGYLDEGAALHLVGRKVNLISVGAEKFSPEEVEDVLLRHPLIADAAVVGLEDPLRGQQACAFVQNTGDLSRQEVVRHCRGFLASYKVPRQVRFVKVVPRNVTGKVIRSQLVAQP